MIGKTFFQGVGVVVLAWLLVSPMAEDRKLSALWGKLTQIFATAETDNRGSLDPNG
ncbi:MAG TPA: hypothetical protein VN493_31845 [Thermoanaerobaculia bacterium]|nr:hypothetical protein [Thermoanaerobaculia bacterium]